VNETQVLKKQKMGVDRWPELQHGTGMRVCANEWPSQTRQQDISKNPEVIDGDDSKKSSRVKRFEVVWRAPRINQNPANEEARKNEEKIDPGPAHDNNALKKRTPATCLCRSLKRNIVKEKDQKNGNAP